ncbi:MAG: acyltransferase domain-containing protein [Candidatus Heimdallarchaeota archaeon]|nr:acyltransferase domain-containing protein [Candidatus Heimdallarchaeota archaeon]
MSKAPKLEQAKIYGKEPIAVVGLGGIFPDSNSIDEFWQNIITGHSSIDEVPLERWDPKLYYDEDREAPDKTYTKIGAFVKNFEFKSFEYRIPPTVATQMDKVQQYALYAAKEALEDAKYNSDSFPRDSCAVIIGNSGGGELKTEYNRRILFPHLEDAIKKTDQFKSLNKKDQKEFLSNVEKEYKVDLKNITEDSMPGELPNIIAGRIASVFNLRGMNITSDAACASSLAAIEVAYKGLLAHDYDAAVVGGSDRTMDATTYVKFSKIGALSEKGSFPFDARANGFVMGEGSGMFILKRLSDAIEANDNIYGLIIGVGASSDGKGKGITAPNPIGQELAVQRAYENTGITPNDIQLIEAHGTSTPVGDRVEVNTLAKVFKEAGVTNHSIKIGSIKSQVGHLKSAAGAAAIVKTILGLHHKIMPPSINFETPNPNIDWDSSPFVVNTEATEWKMEKDKIRRAGVSSFGFGGTNFHVILEEYDSSRIYTKPEVIKFPEISKTTSDNDTNRHLTWDEYSQRNRNLEKEAILLSARSLNELLTKLDNLPNKIPIETISVNPNSEPLLTAVKSLNFNPKHDFRLGIALPELAELNKYSKLASGALQDQGRQGVARARGIFTSVGLPDGKVAFVFPGQGSQYADMLYDLSLKYKIVRQTIEEADEILEDYLDEPLSSYLFTFGRDRKEVDTRLRQTEITQPAMLTVDIALFRLLQKFGIKPDMVAGHSLGEYAALVAAEVLTFKDALIAVAIRGKAMSEVDVEDKGTMASISGTIKEVEDILKKLNGYVIAANKNSISQTVISGSTEGINEAIKEFEARGMSAIQLSVSAAFHTKIVAPAAEPLSEYLGTIKFKKPKIPITSNVSGSFFPKNPEKIRELLKKQVGSAVEWTSQVKSMHNEGATIFFEVGPKKALSGFVADIIGDRNALTVSCNHPKKGGIQTFNEAIAAAGAVGLPLKSFGANSNIFVPEYRWPQNGKLGDCQSEFVSRSDAMITSQIFTSATSKAQQVTYDLHPHAFKEFMEQTVQYLKSDSTKVYKLNLNLENIVITGIGVGLPGLYKEVFDENNFDRILNGENLIDRIPQSKLEAQFEKKIVRLIKKSGSEPVFHSPTSYDEVLNLAGQMGKFDLVEEFQIADGIADTYDTTTELAIAAGLLALRDAGIPLVRSYKKTTTGSYLPGPWVLPEELQDETGVIFASSFPGVDKLSEEIQNFNDQKYIDNSKRLLSELYSEITRKISNDKEKNYLLNKIEKELTELEKNDLDYHFNRKFLLNILTMGHSQFAQLIRARGPNTHVNAACASTTQALGVANDWLRSGRCKRVIVISGDNISSDTILPWVGTGFLASGAATTKKNVEEAALPFDRRREGLIIGMGAAALVVETESEAQRRGVTPLVELLGAYYANSSFHGTRLDINHVSESVQNFIKQMEQAHGIPADEMAKSMMFMSHETYTPARGGSAGAEIRALRDTFGDGVSNIIIANTKGFTGHAMGAGIEDVVAIKSMEVGKIPPIANFKEGDEELGPLRLSQGENVTVNYTLRLAAGFGSQIALALFKKRSSGNRFGLQYDGWLETLGGKRTDLIKLGKTLRLKDKGIEGIKFQSKIVKQPTPQKIVKPKPRIVSSPVQTKPKSVSKPLPERKSIPSDNVKNKIIEIIAEKTGYPVDLLDPELDMEADLGIDTVKQAEIFGLLREEYNLEREEGVQIADFPTINAIADYFTEESGTDSVVTKVTPSQDSITTVESDLDRDKVLSEILDVIAEKTGYPVDMLDPELDMEADLGIDTVKQAELFGMVREQYQIERLGDIQISDYPTISAVADFVMSQSGGVASPQSSSDVTKKTIQKPVSKPVKQAMPTQISVDDNLLNKVQSIIAEYTGYPESLLNEMVSFRDDLGQDEEALADLINKINNELNLGVDLSNISEINFISDLFKESQSPKTKQVDKAKVKPQAQKTVTGVTETQVLQRITEIIAEKTGYPIDMLDPELDMEADLGIDTVKQAELFGMAREEFSVSRIESMELGEYNTIHKISDLIFQNAGDIGDIAESTSMDIDIPKSGIPTYRYTIRYNKKKLGSSNGKLNGIMVSRKNKALDSLAENLGLNVIPVLKSNEKLESNSSLLLINPTKTSIGSISKLYSVIKSNLDNLTGLFIAVKSKKTEITPIHQLNPIQGAIGGLFKSISKEFPQIQAKIVLYEKETQLNKELLTDGVEVIYRNNNRLEVALQSEDLPESSWKLSKFDILLATGGAQGITYEIIKNIITKGTTIILLGRTNIRSDAEIIANLSESELRERKELLKEDLKSAGKKVTPVVLEKEWSVIYKSAQVWRHKKELQDLGATVYYESVDIASTKAVNLIMKKLNDQININGITHFIHGAGLEISRPTISKSQKEFELVYSVKVDGFENIYKFLEPGNLKRVLLFTSIAGRFGNATQADYSAANEYLAKRCRELSDKGVNATAIDWSAWADVGMATRGSAMTILSALGLTAIPLDKGINRAIQEIEHGKEVEVVISGELGALTNQTNWYKGKEHPTVMIDNLDKKKLQAYRTISLERDSYLDDHRIEGKAVLPGVMGLETIAEMSRAIEDNTVFHLHDVKFKSPVKLPHDKDLELIISREDETSKYYLKSKFIGPDGKQLGDLREHFEMITINSNRTPGFPSTNKSNLELVKIASVMSSKQIYKLFFHGPSYQVIKKLNEVTEVSAISTFNRPKKTMFTDDSELEIDPLAIEAGFQTAGLHLMLTQKQMGLPSGIKQLTVFHLGNSPKYIIVQYLRTNDMYSYYDVDIVDEDGNVLIKMEEYEMIHTGDLETLDVKIQKKVN